MLIPKPNSQNGGIVLIAYDKTLNLRIIGMLPHL